MRPRLLLSVARLPTIRESWEEALPGGPRPDALASPSLGDPRTPTCRPAQPTSAPGASAGARARAGRKSPPRPLQDITAHVSGQRPPSAADPLGRLSGRPPEEQPRCRGPPRRTGPSAESWGPHGQAESSEAGGCPTGKLYAARAPGRCPGAPLRDWHQGSRASGQPIRAAASPPTSRPSGVLRTLYLHLPVIHEL